MNQTFPAMQAVFLHLHCQLPFPSTAPSIPLCIIPVQLLHDQNQTLGHWPSRSFVNRSYVALLTQGGTPSPLLVSHTCVSCGRCHILSQTQGHRLLSYSLGSQKPPYSWSQGTGRAVLSTEVPGENGFPYPAFTAASFGSYPLSPPSPGWQCLPLVVTLPSCLVPNLPMPGTLVTAFRDKPAKPGSSPN